MLVGTAGHIDHGKTTLVKALTGVDTDRLPEERRRGISIELGYAFVDAPGGERIGFVDVPGHERLVHTMVAGATGIDFALLVVAADDGPMPQTHEHLAVLSLLGIGRGAVALTKCDLVEPSRVAAVEAAVRALLAGTPLAQAPVLPVAATAGVGLAALREQLFAAAASPRAGADSSTRAFRLAVDRVFTLPGVGTVATGTVHAGSVAAGDTVAIVPGGGSARVRSVHAQNRAAEAASVGARCALALAGVERSEIARGQWLVAPAVAVASDRIDVRLALWHGEAAALRSGTAVHVHLGAAATTGSVALLDRAALAPGDDALAQLVLREPLGAWHGEPVLLRDAAAARTIAGARVLDPRAPARYRRTPARLAELAALEGADPAGRLRAQLEAAPGGIELAGWRAAQGGGATEPPADALRHTDAQGDWALAAVHADRAEASVHAALAAFHAAHPDESGPEAGRLRRLAVPRLAPPLWRALLARGEARASWALRGAFVQLPDHAVRLSALEERIAQKAAPRLAAAGFEGAWVRDLARASAEPEPLVRVALARLAQRGELHQIVKDLYLPPATLERLAALARESAAEQGGELTAARFRDATGLGRKRAIQLLEYLDRVGFLRRVGDAHKLRADCRLFDGGTAAAPAARA